MFHTSSSFPHSQCYMLRVITTTSPINYIKKSKPNTFVGMQHFVVNVFCFYCHDCSVFFGFVSLLLLLLILLPPLLPLLLPLLSTVVYPMILQVSLGAKFPTGLQGACRQSHWWRRSRDTTRIWTLVIYPTGGVVGPLSIWTLNIEHQAKLDLLCPKRRTAFFDVGLKQILGSICCLLGDILSWTWLICGWKYRVFKRGCRLKYAESAFVVWKRWSMSQLWFLWMEDLNVSWALRHATHVKPILSPSLGFPGPSGKWCIFRICAAKSVKTA